MHPQYGSTIPKIQLPTDVCMAWPAELDGRSASRPANSNVPSLPRC